MYKDSLTPREQHVLSLLMEGFNCKEISEKLKLSIFTIKTHVHSIYTKKCVGSLQQLICSEYKKRLREVLND